MNPMSMPRWCHRGLPLAAGLALLVVAPARAQAQLYFAGYLGGNYTQASTIAIDAPAAGLVASFRDVQFEAQPLKSPQYYGVRGGGFFGESRRIGLEVEFIHLKVIAKNERVYAIDWPPGTVVPAVVLPMNEYVQRYSMTHGLNFLLVNLVSRTPLAGDQAAVILRAGAGPTIPHSESSVLHQVQQQYEYAGMGAHASAGLDLRLKGRLSVTTEYKFTYARPRITLAKGGSGRTTSASHHVAVGLAFNISR